MKLLPARFLLPALLAAGAPLSPARADTSAPPPAPAKAEPTLSFDFPGGSLGDLIALVQKTNGEVTLNVIGEKAALATEIQPFTVKNADRDAVLRAIGQLIREKGVRVERVDRGVFVVSTDGSRDRRLVHLKNEISFDSFQLAGYIDDQQTVDNIVDVIRSAWTMNPAHDANALQVKFHPATKLLLVSGPPEALQMTREVIHSLHENRRPRGGPPPPFDNK